MNSWTPLLAVIAGAGVALLLARFTVFRSGSLADRLAPHIGSTVGGAAPNRADIGIVALGRELAVDLATKLSDAVGTTQSAQVHLRRTGGCEIGEFRGRQLAWALTAFVTGAGVSLAVGLPLGVAVFVMVGAPTLVVLVIEQRLAERSNEVQRRAELELPVICEQLGMLLSAGYSLTSAMNRISARSDGVIGSGLGRVVLETHHGTSVTTAFRTWSELVDVNGIHRLAGLIALNHEAADLGSLISAEARLARAELHRRQLELIEKRAQQVWVPVTVATLVPGVLFIAVPFINAMSQLTG